MGTREVSTLRTAARWVAAIVLALLAGGCMGLFATRLHAGSSRDIVLVRRPECAITMTWDSAMSCMRRVYFNGDWRGIELCRGTECHKFEDIFKGDR